MKRLVNGKTYNDTEEGMFEFVEEVTLPALRMVMQIPSEMKTMYAENQISGASAELTHDAFRLHEAIHNVYNVYTKLEERLIVNLNNKKFAKEISKEIEKNVYVYDAMRYYFMHHWSKEYMTLLD